MEEGLRLEWDVVQKLFYISFKRFVSLLQENISISRLCLNKHEAYEQPEMD